MTYNILKDAKLIKNDTTCMHDINYGFNSTFPNNGDVDGWNIYNNIYLYGSWNKVLFGSSLGVSCYFGREINILPVVADDYYYLHMMMKLTAPIHKYKDYPTKGKIQWITNTDDTWNDDKSVEFDLEVTDNWKLYIINMAELQYWSGNIVNFRIYPFIDGYEDIQFAVKYIRVVSDNKFQCLNTNCSYYTKYSHPCPATGRFSSITAGESKTHYTTVSGVSDTLYVNIDDYGSEKITLGNNINITGDQMAKIIGDRLSAIDVGGYTYAYSEHTEDNKLKIISGNLGITGDSEVIAFEGELAIFVTAYNCLVDPSYFTSRNLNYVMVNAYLNMISGSVLDILKFLFTNEYNPSLITVSEFLINNSIFQNILDIKFSEPLTFYQMKAYDAHYGNSGASLVLDSMGDIYVCGSINDFYWGGSYYPPNELKDVTNDYLLIDNPQTDMFAGEPYTGKASSTSELFLRVNYGSCRFIFATLSHQDLEIGNTGAEQQYDLIEKFDQFAGSESVGGQSGYSGFFTPFTIVIEGGSAKEELGFNEDSINVTSSKPASGFDFASSRRLKAYEINRLVDNDKKSTAYYHDPDQRVVEAGRRDYFEAVSTYNVASNNTPDFYSEINGQGYILIDLTHPVTDSGRLKHIKVNGSKYSGFDPSIIVFRSFKDGTLIKLYEASFLSELSTSIYSTVNSTHHVETDFMVSKGDLIGFKNFGILCPHSSITLKPNAMLYKLGANDNIDVRFEPGNIFCQGVIGPSYYAYSERVQDSIKLSVDFGKRINIGEINVHGKEFNDTFEYNVASCLDVSWQCNLYNESHGHSAYHDTGLYMGYWTHKNIAYGLDSLNNCKTTVDNGRQGTSFTGGNGGNGLATFGEHSYFYVNGDAEWLYGVSSSKSEFWYPWRNAVTYDYEFDPVALYIHFPHNKNINIHRSIIYFKESENFKKMFLAYYMAPAGLPGNSGQYGYSYIPNFSSVKLDGTKYTAEDVGGTKYSTADLIMPNPMPNSKMIYVDGEASDENWALYQVAGNTEWNVMEHNFEPINCYGFMVYCDWHKSTKIIEMELYSSFPVKPVLVDNIFMSSSIYGDYWDTILFKEDNKDPNKAYSNLVSSPRYFNMEFSPQSAFELYELSFEVAESDLKLLDCNNTVLMDSAPRNQMTSPKKLEIENVYDVPLKLSVSVPTKFIPNNNLLSHIKMVSQETTEYAEVGPGAVVEKNDDYSLELYNSQVAINCPSYYLKNLAADSPIWAFEKNKYWKDLGLSGSKGEINYLNESGIFKASITFDATSSKFWKFNILTHEFHRFYTVNVLYNNEIVAIKDLYVQAQSKGLGSIKQVIDTDPNGEYIPTPVIYDNFSDNDFINYWQYNIPLGNYFQEINNVLKPELLLPGTTSYFERNLQCPLNSFAFETEFYYNPIDYRNLIGYKVELLDNYDAVVMGLELNNDEEDLYINIYTSNLDKEYEPTSSYQNDHSYYSQSHKLGFIDSLGGNFRFSITKEFRDYTEIKLSALPSLSGSEYCSAKSVVFDIADNHGHSTFLAIRSIEFKFHGTLIINSNPVVYATSNISNSGYEPWRVFDTDLSKIGDWQYNTWVTNIITNQRLIVVFDSETEFDEIVVNNAHHYGDTSSYTTTGAKNVVIHISSDIVTDTTYGAPIPNSRKIFDGVFDEHVASDIEDDQSLLGLILDLVSFDDSYVFYDGTKTDTIYLLSRVHKARISYINNSLVSLPLPDIVYDTYFAKTLIFDCENNWGRSDGMGIRMVELLDINGDTIPLIPSDYSSYDSYHYSSNTIFGTAFDTTRSKTGSLSDWRSDYNAGWVACCGGSLVSNQRGVIVFNSDIVFYGVRINNYHNGGGTTNAGVKDIKVYLSRAIIDDTTYGGSLHGTHMIFDGQIDEHVSLDIVDDQTLSGIAEYNYDQSATFFYSNSIELDALPIISQDESLIIELTGSNPANEINLIMNNTDLSDGSLYFSNTGQDDFTLWAQNIDRFSLLTEDQASVHASGWRYNFILTYYYYNAYPYWALLDDILSGYYDNQQTLWMDQRELPIWWIYDFGAGNERKVDYMYVKLGVVDPTYSTPDTLTIYGSNDASLDFISEEAKSKDFISQHTIDMSSGQPELYINTNIINYYRHYCFVFTDTSGSTDPFSAGIHLVKFYEDLTESTSDLSTEVNYYDHYFAIDLGQRYVLDFMRNYGDDPDKIYLPDIFTGVDYSLSEVQDPNNVVWSTDDYLGGSFSARSIIFDIADNYGYSAYISIRSLEFKLDGVLIPNPAPTAYYTSCYNSSYTSYYAFDTDRIKTGSWYQTSWRSYSYNITNQRLIVVFDSETEFDEIVVNNGHSYGGYTSTGAKNVVIHISSDIVTDTTYGAPIPNSRKIFDGVFDEHVASDIEDDKTVPADTRLPEEVIDYEPIPGTSFSMVGSSYYARWVKIPLLCGDGVDRLIQQLGIYPDTHYAYTKDGKKNCEWGSLGNALTGYGVTYNLAEGGTISGVDDGDYFSDWSPYKCITGGRENYGYENCWGFNATSGSTYPSFVLDLGDVYYVSKFFITHCYSDYDLTTWQNEDYNIYGKNSWNESFTLLFSITNNSSLSREHILDEALQVRYIKLEITNYIKPTEPFRIYDVSTGDYIYFDGGFVRTFEVWSANNVSLVNSEDHPVICTNLKDSYTISSHSLVTIKQTDGEEDEDIEWDNSEEFFKYSDNYSDDPSNVSFLDSSGVQTIFSDGSEFLSQSQNEDEMRIRTDLYLAPGRYSIDWESYGAVSEEAVALKFTGIDIKIIPSSNIATSWVTQSDYLSVDEDSYYTIDAICQVTDTERWGVRNIVIQQNNSNNSKWILVQRNTATDFAWNNLEDDKEIDYLNNLKVYATNTYMPTEKYWWWSSTESTLSNDVVNTKVGHASLKIEYPTSSGVDRVDFIEGDHFGWDQNWSIKDSLCFWLYISDIDKLYTEAGGFGFGSFYGGTSEMFIDDLDKQKNITPETAYYTWDFNELNLKTGWNKVRLQFDRNTLTVPLTSNTTFTLEDELNFRDNNYFTSFGIVYRGVGESFYMLLDDLKIERNWFNDDVYDNEKGLCLTWKEYAEVPVGGLNVRRGSIEFWVKLYTDMAGKDSFGKSRSRTLFTITNSNNEIISLIVKSSGWLEVGFGGARNNFNIMYADPYVYDLSTVSFIKDEPFHIAMTWSNDGSGMDNADTMRLYINNTFVISSKETWNVGDSKTSTLRFGGATTILAGNNDLEGSAIFSNIKTYDYCKNNFEINNLTSKGVEALNSNSIIQLSSDGENFYDINSGKLPIVYEEVPPGDKVDIYTRVDKTKMDLIEKQSGIIDIEWEVIV